MKRFMTILTLVTLFMTSLGLNFVRAQEIVKVEKYRINATKKMAVIKDSLHYYMIYAGKNSYAGFGYDLNTDSLKPWGSATVYEYSLKNKGITKKEAVSYLTVYDTLFVDKPGLHVTKASPNGQIDVPTSTQINIEFSQSLQRATFVLRSKNEYIRGDGGYAGVNIYFTPEGLKHNQTYEYSGTAKARNGAELTYGPLSFTTKPTWFSKNWPWFTGAYPLYRLGRLGYQHPWWTGGILVGSGITYAAYEKRDHLFNLGGFFKRAFTLPNGTKQAASNASNTGDIERFTRNHVSPFVSNYEVQKALWSAAGFGIAKLLQGHSNMVPAKSYAFLTTSGMEYMMPGWWSAGSYSATTENHNLNLRRFDGPILGLVFNDHNQLGGISLRKSFEEVRITPLRWWYRVEPDIAFFSGNSQQYIKCGVWMDNLAEDPKIGFRTGLFFENTEIKNESRSRLQIPLQIIYDYKLSSRVSLNALVGSGLNLDVLKTIGTKRTWGIDPLTFGVGASWRM